MMRRVGAGTGRFISPGIDTLQFDFAPSSSSTRYLVLYDSEALPANFSCDPDTATSEPAPPPDRAVEELGAACSALVVHVPRGDCAVQMQVFVDEDPPERLCRKRKANHAIENSLLRVPGGRLMADGAEFLQMPGREREWATRQRARLPAGEYRLDAFHLAEWKDSNRRAGIASEASPVARALDWIISRVALARIVLVIANLAIIPVLLLSITSGWRSALTGLGALLVADLVLVCVFWLVAHLLKRHPASRQVQRAREKFDLENPDVVVVLRREAGPRPSPAAAFLRIAP